MHVVSIADLSDEAIVAILDKAASYGTPERSLAGKIVCTAFMEPSTRTRLSFEAAAHRLGADVIGFSDAATTSGTKGESLEDATRVLAGYADVLVLRSPEEGAAARAAKVSPVPVINAGDGTGEHPTQTLVDLFTIRQALGHLDGLRVAVIGDLLHGRTVHSLVPALRRFGTEVVQVPVPGMALPDHLDAPHVTLEEAAACDVMYATRVQRERFGGKDFQASMDAVTINADLLNRTGSNAVVLHPLPRVDEVADDVDDLPSAKYFEQARNGVAVRMALLETVLRAP